MSGKEYCLLALGAAMLLTGCRTNEKNYRTAYEAALSRRAASDADAAVLSDGHTVISIDEPSRVKAGDDEVYLERRRLKPDDSGMSMPEGRFCVAVGSYRMPTNARSQVDDLKSGRNWKGAYVARGADGSVWSVIGAYPTLEEAAQAISRFRKEYPGYTYVGLPGEPIIVEQ